MSTIKGKPFKTTKSYTVIYLDLDIKQLTFI